jgi:hypothetical protein
MMLEALGGDVRRMLEGKSDSGAGDGDRPDGRASARTHDNLLGRNGVPGPIVKAFDSKSSGKTQVVGQLLTW